MTARPTSLAARSSPRPARQQRRQVFLFVLDKGEWGATLEEIEAGLGLSGNTVRPRRQELEKKLLIADSGKTRTTSSGRQAIVWIVPPKVALRTAAIDAIRSAA